MYLIDIIAVFDFLEKEVKIGTLEYERIKGSASFPGRTAGLRFRKTHHSILF